VFLRQQIYFDFGHYFFDGHSLLEQLALALDASFLLWRAFSLLLLRGSLTALSNHGARSRLLFVFQPGLLKFRHCIFVARQ